MSANVHDRIEAIAGAIALGEASDGERREYREHIAACRSCLQALGGEREIERVAASVDAARDAEVWEPAVGDVVQKRMRRRSRTLRFGVGLFSVALLASFSVHALLAASVRPAAPAAVAPSAVQADATRVVLERRAQAPKLRVVAVAPPQRLIVTHNVVQIARAPLAAPAAEVPAKTESKPRELIAITVRPDPARKQRAKNSNVPVWRRDENTAWRTIAQTTTTSVTESAPQTLTHSAESLQVAANYPSREVAPLGGETAINPQPPLIAYAEGAEGTTVFEVRVDERGVPTKCIITKSAGYTVLDDAVCKAAMKARYTAKIVDGRPVPGVYRDAFTFRMTDQTASSQGIQSQIPAAGPYRNPHNPGVPSGTSPLGDTSGGIQY